MELANKEFLLLLLLIVPYLVWRLKWRKQDIPTLNMSDLWLLKGSPRTLRQRLAPWFTDLLRVLAFVFVVIAMARPQTHNAFGERTVEGIDIMLAMDVSTSMLAEDLKPNRLEAAKAVAAEFISDRSDDNIGMTIFAGEAFTQCPMTTDHAALLSLLKDVRTDIAARGMIQDGTAIGMGLANAISRLKESKAKSRVVILLTDGSNNMGEISPNTSAEIANSLGIRVYTIGLGTNGHARYPMPVAGGVQYINLAVEIDEATLSSIAQTTGGNYYRATNNKELRKIYSDIDKLERSKLNVKTFSKRYEAFQPFVIIALLLIIFEMLLRMTYFRRIP